MWLWGWKMKKLILFGILISLVFLVGCNITGNTVSEAMVKMPLSKLSNEVQFFEHEDNGVKIKYFMVLGSDGKVRTAFDACDVCGGSKGYEQKGNDIVCRNCGRVFDIDGLGTQNKGYGCWPSYLPHEIKGDELFIKIKDIESGRHRFA